MAFPAALALLLFALRQFRGFGAAAPDERSNHKQPTPQVGGIGIVPVWIAAMAALSLLGAGVPHFGSVPFLLAVALLFVLGVADDRKPMGPLPKLAGQLLACGLATWALADLIETLPLPFWVASLACAGVLLAIVNLANFIDGLDLMAVATIGLPSAGFAVFALIGLVGYTYLPAGLVAATVFAAFAICNWHPARTFLGDGGSLPFGLILGAMTIVTAVHAGPMVAALLPAYLIFDGGITLVRRALRGERLMQGHSSHLYQRAFRSGRPVLWVSATAAGFGLLGIVAAVAVSDMPPVWQAGALLVMAVAWLGLERSLPVRTRGG